jgi:quercetin dioxygenase-like cupin family protein
MIKYEWYQSGQLFGMRYEIPAGESIKQHTHDDSTLHNVIVLKGAVVFKYDGKLRILDAGQVRDFDGSKPHTITAMSDGATTLHFFLNGMPRGYAALPESEHSGEF